MQRWKGGDTMTKMIVELAVVLLAIILAGVFLKKNTIQAKKAFAISFALTFAPIIPSIPVKQL